MRRREFIERAAVGSAAILAGCGGEATPPAIPLSTVPTTTTTPSPLPSPSPSPSTSTSTTTYTSTSTSTSTTPATDAEWETFASSLDGRLVRPSAAEYALSRQLYD